MKSKMTSYIVTLFLCTFSLFSEAQTTIPKGKAQLIEFTNATAKFTVPDGKTWVIYSFFSDYIADGVIKYNESYKVKELESEDVRIFLKELNVVEKTNYIKSIYGTQLYRSSNASTVIPYPLVFPEKTTFSLINLKGSNLGEVLLYNGSAFISFIEVDN